MYATSPAMCAGVRLAASAARAFGTNGASGNVRARRTRSQWPCTAECQSKQPQNAGVSSRGGLTSASLASTCAILFGYSLCTQARARSAKRCAAAASKAAGGSAAASGSEPAAKTQAATVCLTMPGW